LDTAPPYSLSISINNGSSETNSTNVSLKLHARDVLSGVHLMAFSTDGKNWGVWENYSNLRNYSLPHGDGEKTIYFKVMDLIGNIADPISKTIILNTTTATTPLNEDLSKKDNNSGNNFQLSNLYPYFIIFVIIIIISTIFVSKTEIGKYGFYGFFIPLYTKRRKKKIDENYGYKKGLVLGCIMGNPGESYNAIKRALNLNNGTLTYYLRILENEGTIKSERDGMYKRFYPTEGKAIKNVLELSDMQKEIYRTIKENIGITQKEISSHLDVAQQTVNYHIQLMKNARIIRLDREAKNTKCFIIEEVT